MKKNQFCTHFIPDKTNSDSIVRHFTDIHTHIPGKPLSILSVPVCKVEQLLLSNACNGTSAQYYSLQLHPWHLNTEEDIVQFTAKAKELREDPHFVAVGECGLDGLADTPLPLQLNAFRAALQIAEELQKPVIIHCVKLWSELIAETRGHKGLMIVHGFRKGPALAQQLLDAGFSLSLGSRYNEEVMELIPPERLYRETDEE